MPKSLEFILALDNTKFNRGLDAAERKAKQVGKKMADAFDPTMDKLKSLRSMAAKGIFGAGLAGGAAAIAGLAVLKEGLSAAVEEASELDSATFALSSSLSAANKQFDVGSMEEWNSALVGLSDSLKIYSEKDLKNAAASTIDMTKRLGLEASQMEKVIQVAGELGAGKFELADSVERVTAALRGEAEASEALGLTLNENYVKAWYEANDATGKAWKDLNDIEKAQARFNVLLDQAGPKIGQASESLNTYNGALGYAKTGITNLETAIGSTITKNQFFIEGLKLAAETFNSWAGTINSRTPEAMEYAKQLALALLAAGEGGLTALDYIYRGAQGIAGLFQRTAAFALDISGGIFKIIEAGTALTDWLGISTDATEDWAIAAEAAFNAAADLKQKAGDNFEQMENGQPQIQAARDALKQFREEMEKIPSGSMDDVDKGAEDVKGSMDDIVTVAGDYTVELEQVNGVWVQQQKEIDTAISKAKELKSTVNDISATSYTGMSGGGFVLAMAGGGGIRSASNGFHFTGYGGGDQPKNLVMAEDGEVMLRKEAVRAGGLRAALAFNAGRFDIVLRELTKRFDTDVIKRRLGGPIRIPALPQMMSDGGEVAMAGATGGQTGNSYTFTGPITINGTNGKSLLNQLMNEATRATRRSS